MRDPGSALPADLRAVAVAWATLPEHARRAIKAIVDTADLPDSLRSGGRSRRKGDKTPSKPRCAPTACQDAGRCSPG